MDPTGGILPYVLKKLGDFVLGEITRLGRTREDLDWVQRELRTVQAFLNQVATINIQDAGFRMWIDDVRELAFHAEDVVDTLSLHAGIKARRSLLPCCCISRTKSRHGFGMEIARLKKMVVELFSRKVRYRIGIPDTTSVDAVDRTKELLPFRKSKKGPYVEDKYVIGLDRHVEAVTELLHSGGSRRSVVAIVGMGGIGKTTIAKKVYTNVLKSSSSFDCTAWVVVTLEYNFLDLLQRIARDFMKLSIEDVQKMDILTVAEVLRDFIQSQKYLIVLDDVWASEIWDVLDTILPDQNNGSRIITTTRNVEVARSANPQLPPYEVPTLKEEDSRTLFTKIAFPGEEDPEQCCTRAGLASLRDKIVKKCGGLPLAIVVVGGVFSMKERTLTEWMKVAQKIDWQHTTCMEILALSYWDLSLQLRWCFLYLASFPEDCEASVNRLQRLWIAEGFIEEKEGASLEETAERCFQELVQRCLLQVVDRSHHQHSVRVERCCRVQDLVLELAVSKAREMRFLDAWRIPFQGSQGALSRRLSITAYDDYEEMRAPAHLPLESNKLRTLLIMDRRGWKRGEDTNLVVENIACNIVWSSIQRNLKLLRVLELGVYLRHLPDEIENMVNLRYLSFSSYEMIELPKSLGNLRYLQTLDVGTAHVICLPVSIWRIKTLRYLRGGWETRIPAPEAPHPDDVLQDLRALRHVRAHPWMQGILPCLSNLRELEICRDRDGSVPDYLCSTVERLQSLEVLILVESKISYGSKSVLDMDRIFSPSNSHACLHTLELSDLKLNPSNIQELPQNLRQVKLAYARIDHGLVKLLGKLPSLHLLSLFQVSIFEEEMIFESGWFPQLIVLVLDDLNIKTWKLDGESLPPLRELVISRCSRLQALPKSLPPLKEYLKIVQCPGLRDISTPKSSTLRGVPSRLHEN